MKSNILVTLLFLLFLMPFTTNAQKLNKPKIASKSVSNSPKKRTTAPAKSSKAQFVNEKIDFGTVKENVVVEKKFEFTNAGNANLVIMGAETICSCTTPIFSKEPIKPGEKGEILVRFAAKNRFGPQKPVITVTTNGTPRIIKLQLEGWVEQIPGGVKD